MNTKQVRCPKGKNCSAKECTHRDKHERQWTFQYGNESLCRQAFGVCPACQVVKEGEK